MPEVRGEYGLRAFAQQELGNWQERLYWRQAALDMAPLNVPLREVALTELLCPWAKGSDRLPVLRETGLPAETGWPCFIVENAGVFSTLLEGLQAPGLRELAVLLWERGTAFYQESLLEAMLVDLLK